GKDTLFWLDPWLEDGPFKCKFPRVYALEDNKHVSVGDKLNMGISASLRRFPRGGAENSQMNNLRHLVNEVVLSGVMGSGEGYGMAVECTRDSGFGQKPWGKLDSSLPPNLDLIATQSDLASATFCLAVLGARGEDVSPVGAGSSSRSPLAITSHRLCGWRSVLFCHLTIEFFLFRVSTQALIPLVGSLIEWIFNLSLVKGNGGNQFRQYAGQNIGNQNGYNAVQNVRNQVVQNAVQNLGVQNVRNQNGLIVILGIANHNMNGNGNVVAARTEGNANRNNGNQIRCYNCRGLGHLARNCTVRPRRRDASYLQTQLLIAQKEETGIQLQVEEFDLMAAAADLDEIDEVGYSGKQITTLNEEISNLNKQLSKEKATVSSLQEEKKRLKSDFKIREDEFLDKQIQLENKIKELDNILVKMRQSIQTIHMLLPKPDSFYHTGQKMALGYQNPFYLKQAQQKQQSLYNDKVLLGKHDPPAVYDSEETLELAQEKFSDDTTPSVARKFLNEVKSTIVTLQRVVKQKMTLDIHNWSSSAHQEIHKIVKDEIFPIVNQVDARVQNFEIQFLKEAAKFVRDFQSLANEADESLAKHKALELEIERLLRAVVSQDIMSIVQNNSVVDTSNLQTELEPQLGDHKGKSKDTPCVSNTLDPLPQKLKNENVELEFQNKLHDTIYENAKLRAQLVDKVSEQNDTTRGTSANTKFAKQSILGKLPSSSRPKLYAVTPLPKSTAFPKVGETNALSNQVTSNWVPSSQESNIVKNDNVLSLRIFRMNPFKASRVDNFVPNKHVNASVRTKPITVSQPYVITKNDVNSKTNGFSPKDVKSTTRTRRPLPINNTKNDKVPSKSKSSRLSNNLEKIEENHRNLQSFSNQKHMLSECNNIKLAIQNAKYEIGCAMCKQCLITVNHDVCVLNYVNSMNSRDKKKKANVSNIANQTKHKA
ncbi:retrovirus-related pol polyprotein from transposon TNT 1-94, partial [Tanacetum coccineum]